MRSYLTMFFAASIASFFVATVAIEAVHDFKNPPGPCSVLDLRRCK